VYLFLYFREWHAFAKEMLVRIHKAGEASAFIIKD
jgi:hypothetical protein